MRLAIEKAHLGGRAVAPNPMVGCVVLDAQNRLLSTGYHRRWGGPHAECEALEGVPVESLRGARLFVTLEPCAHEGHTPSCARYLASLGLSEVYYGLLDPNPLTYKQGIALLAQNCQVKAFSCFHAELEELIGPFREQLHKRTFVALKVAMGLDGYCAAHTESLPARSACNKPSSPHPLSSKEGDSQKSF